MSSKLNIRQSPIITRRLPGLLRPQPDRILSRPILVFLILLFCAHSGYGQSSSKGPKKDLFATTEEAIQLRRTMSVSAMKFLINQRVDDKEAQSASDFVLTAELMKQIGDYRAQDYYEKAIKADEAEPGYELFYADYLRNFRGPSRPLFPEAERHYFEALRKYLKLAQHIDAGRSPR